MNFKLLQDNLNFLQDLKDLDDLKDKLDTTTIQDIIKYIKASSKHYEECKILFFDTDVKAKRLYESKSMKELGFFNYDDMIQMLANPDSYIPYFTDHDVYVSVRLLQQIVGNFSTSTGFTQAVKKIYNVREFMPLYGNKPYVKCTFINNRLKILSI